MTLALGGAVAGCSSDDPGTGPGVNPAVLGTWTATSFVAGGNDLITMGMTLNFTFNSDGTYAFAIVNDQGGLCDMGVADCADFGDYTASATQIVLDPGTVDVVTFNYSISGTVMTVNTVIDGTSATVTFDKL